MCLSLFYVYECFACMFLYVPCTFLEHTEAKRRSYPVTFSMDIQASKWRSVIDTQNPLRLPCLTKKFSFQDFFCKTNK